MKQKWKEIIKKIFYILHINPQSILYFYKKFFQHDVLYNVHKTQYKKNCLLQYIVQPFLEKEINRYRHQNQWQVKVLVDELGNFGYNVDVRDIEDTGKRLKHKYDLVVDIHIGLNTTYKKYMNSGCRWIAYLTGMNPRVANHNEQIRLEALTQRRGIVLPPERQGPLLSREVEKCDAFFFIGNAYNLKSYEEFHLPPVYFIKNHGYNFPFMIDYTCKDPKKFLFFASVGQVHKGLDLLLEIFSKKDFSFELYVCSDFLSEREFCAEYQQELFHTSNIHPIGFIDIMGQEFRHIVEVCSFLLMPSCSEGIAGSVLTGMSAGVIPIVSRECGFEEDEVFHLQDCRMETIENAIRYFGNQDKRWIQEKATYTKNIVKERYSEEDFIQSVRQALEKILKD